MRFLLGVFLVVAFAFAVPYAYCEAETGDGAISSASIVDAAPIVKINHQLAEVESFQVEVEPQEVDALSVCCSILKTSVEQSEFVNYRNNPVQNEYVTLVRKWCGNGPIHQWIMGPYSFFGTKYITSNLTENHTTNAKGPIHQWIMA